MPRQSIPCPECNHPITLDTGEMLQGKKFTCDGCGCTVGMASESRPELKAAADLLSGN